MSKKKAQNFRVPKYKYGQEVFIFDTERGVLDLIVDSVSISDEGVTYYLRDIESSFSYGMRQFDENAIFDTKEGLVEWVNKKLK